MNSGSLLLVDDDSAVLESMADTLRSLGYRSETATDCQEAIARMKDLPFDAVICDVNLPDQDGFRLLEWSRTESPDTQIILLTGFGTIERAVDAIRLGASDYLTKPVIDDELDFSIRRALARKQTAVEDKLVRQALNQRFGLGNIVGHDYRMQKMFDLIESVSDTRTTVLVLGESGTGKTMIARAIHQMSQRRDKPFVEVACGAMPDSLLESELFGHVAGAFTGANHDKMGKFLQANGGTIFLDEIGTASQTLQVKLLRVLQDREFEPVGSTKTQKVDVRMILATNIDLEEAVRKGEFRKDLYYRINVVSLTQPPLRERASDIPLLAEHYLQEFISQTGKGITGFSREAMDLLRRYRWPGNVRELINVIERAVVLTKNPVIQASDFPETLRREEPENDSQRLGLMANHLKSALASPEKQLIIEALETHGWNRQETSDSLGINRTTLYKKMKKYGISFEKQLMS
jgi:two-component system response regulator HydG